jgi:hypothetical protein
MSDFKVTADQMQKLADADAVLADLAMEAMVSGDNETFSRYVEVGLPVFELQHELVEKGLAAEVLDRSDRDEADAALLAAASGE